MNEIKKSYRNSYVKGELRAIDADFSPKKNFKY